MISCLRETAYKTMKKINKQNYLTLKQFFGNYNRFHDLKNWSKGMLTLIYQIGNMMKTDVLRTDGRVSHTDSRPRPLTILKLTTHLTSCTLQEKQAYNNKSANYNSRDNNNRQAITWFCWYSAQIENWASILRLGSRLNF